MSEYTSVMTRKGQITVPAEIRRTLGLKEGDRVSFIQDGDDIRLVPTGSITERTAGIARRYYHGPAPTEAELREAFERGVAEEVIASMER
jgi:AbrB family looped-hinge helix DNA binding protein